MNVWSGASAPYKAPKPCPSEGFSPPAATAAPVAVRAWGIIVALVFLAGCAAPAIDSGASDLPSSLLLKPDCAIQGFQATDSGVCARMFRTTAGQEWEPHLAAHPRNEKTLLLTATSIAPGAVPVGPLADGPVSVWAAMTIDGGATWRTTEFGEPLPVVRDVPLHQRYSFDSIAAFGPDGTAYVLFGGENQYVLYSTLQTRLTVARSKDDGATWTMHRFHQAYLGLDSDDYMDLAAAPDSNDLYVVADAYPDPLGGNEILLWRSRDGANTWEPPKRLSPGDHQFPRVYAGRDGLVVVIGYPYADGPVDYAGVDIWISRDGGSTFDAPKRIAEAPIMFEDAIHPAIHEPKDGGQARIDVAYSSENATYLLRSLDEGRTWQAPLLISPPRQGHLANLHEAEVGPDGTFHALERYGRNRDPMRFGIDLLSVAPDGKVSRVELVNKTGLRGEPYVGGHYGGLDAGADGRVWAAWGDPRSRPHRIALASLVPVTGPNG